MPQPRPSAVRLPASDRWSRSLLALALLAVAAVLATVVVALATTPAGANPAGGAVAQVETAAPADATLGPAPVYTEPAAPALGTLGTQPQNAAQESASGVKVAMIEFNWSSEEPQPGVFNTAYESSMKNRLASLQAAGMRITLALGLHFTPSWVSAQPNSRFVDENGTAAAQVDLVFNNQLRLLAQAYITRLATVFPFSQFWAVRLTSGSRSEALYPAGGTYWAFDDSAQNGPNLPPSMARNPYPGWRPGQAGLTPTQVQAWADWYIGALADVVIWQRSLVSALGFTGFFQVLTPGVGIMPKGFQNAVNANLPDGLIGVGAVWDRFYADLAGQPNIVAYVSSLADGSGANGGCQPADAQVALTSTATASWSAARWISRIADVNGFLKSGENPGYSTTNPTSQAFYRDTSASGMEAVAMAQAQTCGFQVVYWAHDDQLWDGTLTLAGLVAWAQPPAGLPDPAR